MSKKAQQTAEADSNATDERPLQEQMEALSTLIDQLEDPNLPLEDALSLYETGMTLVKSAQKALDQAEQRVAMVNANGDAAPLDS